MVYKKNIFHFWCGGLTFYMSLFAKLTGINNKKSDGNQPKDKKEEDKEENEFFSEIKEEINGNKPIKNTDHKPAKNKKPENNPENEEWNAQEYEEGELSLDVYDEKDNIVVKSTIAGVKPEDIDISVNNDMLTIRGKRVHEEKIDEKNYFYRECYWGNFSRTIILPCEVKADKITAKLKNGVLMVKLPKARQGKKVAIKVVEE